MECCLGLLLLTGKKANSKRRLPNLSKKPSKVNLNDPEWVSVAKELIFKRLLRR